jgi:hypothetical protein
MVIRDGNIAILDIANYTNPFRSRFYTSTIIIMSDKPTDIPRS